MQMRRSALAAAVVAAALALSGCAAGQVAATSVQVTATGGIGGRAGAILLRDAQISYDRPVPGGTVYAPGEDAPLTLTLVNEGRDGDRLVAVSSPVATSGAIIGDAALPGGQVLTAGYDDPLAAAALPKASAVTVVLTGLREPIRSGLTYPVVFTFERAGELRVPVPVENPDVLPPRAGEETPDGALLETGPEVPGVAEG